MLTLVVRFLMVSFIKQDIPQLVTDYKQLYEIYKNCILRRKSCIPAQIFSFLKFDITTL